MASRIRRFHSSIYSFKIYFSGRCSMPFSIFKSFHDVIKPYSLLDASGKSFNCNGSRNLKFNYGVTAAHSNRYISTVSFHPFQSISRINGSGCITFYQLHAEVSLFTPLFHGPLFHQNSLEARKGFISILSSKPHFTRSYSVKGATPSPGKGERKPKRESNSGISARTTRKIKETKTAHDGHVKETQIIKLNQSGTTNFKQTGKRDTTSAKTELSKKEVSKAPCAADKVKPRKKSQAVKLKNRGKQNALDNISPSNQSGKDVTTSSADKVKPRKKTQAVKLKSRGKQNALHNVPPSNQSGKDVTTTAKPDMPKKASSSPRTADKVEPKKKTGDSKFKGKQHAVDNALSSKQNERDETAIAQTGLSKKGINEGHCTADNIGPKREIRLPKRKWKGKHHTVGDASSSVPGFKRFRKSLSVKKHKHITRSSSPTFKKVHSEKRSSSKTSQKASNLPIRRKASRKIQQKENSTSSSDATQPSTWYEDELAEDGAHTRDKKLKPLYPPSGRTVVIVESATKARVIQNYLGDMFEVLPSYGHVRDLAGRSGSVRPKDGFSIVWEVPPHAWNHLKSMKVALNGAKCLILASDPDREGEAIAWHVFEMLKQQDVLHADLTVARVVFNEITRSSVIAALHSPRFIDNNLVHAYLARRALDYLIGFNISPLLWRKLPSCHSAGRVQSAALVLLCDRETEIEEFHPQEFWTINTEFANMESGGKATSFFARMTHLNSKKLSKFSVKSAEAARSIECKLLSLEYTVAHVRNSQVLHSSPPPYITSSLQMDAANKLHFSTLHTMKVAQNLFEGIKISDTEETGLITYIRTDGFHVSDEAVKEINSLIMERYGGEFVSSDARKIKKVKIAQEAHEAIRPTCIRRLPSQLVGSLDEDSLRLYTLIWHRTMASYMSPAVFDQIHVDIKSSEGITLRSTGSKLASIGYQAVYKDKDVSSLNKLDEEICDDESAREEVFDVLQLLKPGSKVYLIKVSSVQSATNPPFRYSEGSLVKKLEELGIGRPSTYASILKILQDRNYVTLRNRVLIPEFRGRMVAAFLLAYFPEVVDCGFTAHMENELDNISLGKTHWKHLLREYWERFSKFCDKARNTDVPQLEKMLEGKFAKFLFAFLPDNKRSCPSCQEGILSFKLSRLGAGYFICCDQYPKCKYTAKATYFDKEEKIYTSHEKSYIQPKLLGLHPVSRDKVYLKVGPYGCYVQLGDDGKGLKPKRVPMTQAKEQKCITLEDALEWLKYPLTLGAHPDDGHPVKLRVSQAGYSIRHRRTHIYVPKNVDPQDLTLEAALKLLSSKKARQIGRPRGRKVEQDENFEAIN